MIKLQFYPFQLLSSRIYFSFLGSFLSSRIFVMLSRSRSWSWSIYILRNNTVSLTYIYSLQMFSKIDWFCSDFALLLRYKACNLPSTMNTTHVAVMPVADFAWLTFSYSQYVAWWRKYLHIFLDKYLHI